MHPTVYRSIIDDNAGTWAAPFRGLFRLLEVGYTGGISLRNRWYDARGARTRLPIPVISVGNLTTGGTGKTPFVIELVRRLERMNLSPAVISRGYKAFGRADGGSRANGGRRGDGGQGRPNDEELLIREACPGILCLSAPNRGWAALRAHEKFGADVIVLDDAFQHRRLHRVLDIVLVDATCPFGYNHLLPRGLLREPVHGLRRAHVVVLTRCDQVSRHCLARIGEKLRRLANSAVHLQCNHRVTAIERLVPGKSCQPSAISPQPEDLRRASGGSPSEVPDGGPPRGADGTAFVEGKRAVVFAAIGNPAAFLTTVRSLGVEVVGQRWWPDHHHYRAGEINSLLKMGRFPPHDLLLTTEKDGVKVAEILRTTQPASFDDDLGSVRLPLFVVKIAIDFVADGGGKMQAVLDETLRGESAVPSPQCETRNPQSP